MSEDPIDVTPITPPKKKRKYNTNTRKKPNPNTSIYVIVIDEKTPYYVKTKEAAIKEIYNQATLLSGQETLAGYKSFLKQKSENVIQVYGNFINFIISYDRLLHTVTYKKVKLLPKHR